MTVGPATQPMPPIDPIIEPFPGAWAEAEADIRERVARLAPSHTCTMACGISCTHGFEPDTHVRTGCYNEGAALE